MDIKIEDYEFYIKPGFTDMRKGARSLASTVQDEMHLCPFDKKVFVFCGRSHRSMKAIFWDGSGWIEIIKRLDSKGSFKWPSSNEDAEAVTLEQILGAIKGQDTWRRFTVSHPKYAY